MILSGREHLGRFCIGNLQEGDSMVGNLIRVGLGCVWQVKLVRKKRRKNLFSRSADAQVKRMRKWLEPLSNSSDTS
ncbi:hypothetical protein CLV36_11132 [Laceyella sediminis]|uniref:Uncharacterized protein n=1 Tax=Laceyella sediminis TaxID=573074 RepID=A0ABX5EPZ9_9BACL|nr:hypothetical protein CLV36_11132 [Laceyella sediminis]